jgi:hypothetical protein
MRAVRQQQGMRADMQQALPAVVYAVSDLTLPRCKTTTAALHEPSDDEAWLISLLSGWVGANDLRMNFL